MVIRWTLILTTFCGYAVAWGTTNRREALKQAGAVLTAGVASPAWAAVDLKDDYRQGTAALANMDADAPVPREAYTKLPSGVIYADLRPGKSDSAVQEGSRVNMQWVSKKETK